MRATRTTARQRTRLLRAITCEGVGRTRLVRATSSLARATASRNVEGFSAPESSAMGRHSIAIALASKYNKMGGLYGQVFP